MNNLHLGLSQILIFAAIAAIIPKALNLLNFIKILKNEKELKNIIAKGIDKNTSIIGTLGLEAIIIFPSLYIYKWNFLNAIRNPIVAIYLLIPLFNFIAGFGLYYIKTWYFGFYA